MNSLDSSLDGNRSLRGVKIVLFYILSFKVYRKELPSAFPSKDAQSGVMVI